MWTWITHQLPHSHLSAGSSIVDNIGLLLIVLAIAVVVIGALKTWDVIDKYRHRVKIEELEANRDKLKRYAQYQKRKSLRDAITMLKPEERAHLYSIWEDSSVVSRKTLFRLNELEDRTRRAERGAEMKWTESKIDDLKGSERHLFPEAYRGKRERAK